jgi:CRP/FNR family transcriptional regulator, nitrogen oxide reductase regulator
MTATEFRASNIPSNNELLRGLDRREIDSILAAAQPRRFSARSLITRQDQPANRFFLLWRGRARYFFETADGKKLILVWITPGHILGAAALASTPSRYLVSTEAVRESIVLVWDGRTMRALTQQFPQLLNNVFRTTMDYLSWYTAAHSALISQTARERLAYLLLGYLPSIGKKVTGGIELDVTNEELANAANITPYTTSRLISGWQRTGAIRKYRGKIVLCSPEKLFLRIV